MIYQKFIFLFGILLIFFEREDELLLEVDKKFDEKFGNEDIIKEGEKLPNKIKISLQKGKRIDNEWNDDNKLSSIINSCINIEDNIKNISEINNDINKEFKNFTYLFYSKHIWNISKISTEKYSSPFST